MTDLESVESDTNQKSNYDLIREATKNIRARKEDAFKKNIERILCNIDDNKGQIRRAQDRNKELEVQLEEAKKVDIDNLSVRENLVACCEAGKGYDVGIKTPY